MDTMALLRQFSTKEPVLLDENENKRIEEILKISTVFTKKSKTKNLYKEYRNLIVKEKGSEAWLVIFDIVAKFLGQKHETIFQKLVFKVPSRDEGDQYGTWRRSALTETSAKELYAYLMGSYLLMHDQLPVKMLAKDFWPEEARDYWVNRAYEHVLLAKDIMAAKAGDDSREIDKVELRKLVDEFLVAISEVIV